MASRLNGKMRIALISFEFAGGVNTGGIGTYVRNAVPMLAARGHALSDAWPPDSPTGIQAILYDAKEDVLEGGADRRSPDTAAVGR